ncbi:MULTISPECIES: YopX family protein [Streptococcus]|uniref:YopX family protein n=1 Tax=Streptococcus TaxID=1301 RepID=UPI001564FEDE|nr:MULTISPECIES: YopX family protein [Streptococcus]
MIPRFRAWMKSLKWMCDVTNISFDSKFVDIYQQGDTERCTEISVEFDEIELMQSTGLCDKDGKEIFEGDVLGTKDGLLNGVVEYRSDLGMWTNSLISYNNFERLCNVARNREVIGNIYENSELLEDKE